MKNIKESMPSLKDTVSKYISDLGLEPTMDATLASQEMKRSASDVTEEEIIRRPIKKGISDKLLTKVKMKNPIGKLPSAGKIENKETTGTGGGSGSYEMPLFSTTKGEMEEKWSEKYKDSIDCKNPKGFSQKAHCQGKKKQVSEEKLKGGKADNKTFEDLVKKNKTKGKDIKITERELKNQLNKGLKVEMEHTKDKQRAKEIAMDHLFEDPKYYDKLKKIEGKKTETKESTGVSSSGSYETPGAWAKSTKKKDWRNAKANYMPGAKRVQVKEKCKTFPYCNQGDINALNIFEDVALKNVITKISEKHNISEETIKTIIYHEYQKKKLNK